MTSEREPGARQALARQAGTYVIVGVANTGLSIALLWLLYGLGWPYPVYSAVAYGIMILISFELNRRFTFAARTTSSQQWRRWLVRFFTLHVLNLLLIQAVQAILIEGMHVSQAVGVSVGLLVGLVVGFLGSKWVFENDRAIAAAGDGVERRTRAGS